MNTETNIFDIATRKLEAAINHVFPAGQDQIPLDPSDTTQNKIVQALKIWKSADDSKTGTSEVGHTVQSAALEIGMIIDNNKIRDVPKPELATKLHTALVVRFDELDQLVQKDPSKKDSVARHKSGIEVLMEGLVGLLGISNEYDAVLSAAARSKAEGGARTP